MELGAGDAAGRVAGGLEGPPARRLFCVVLAIFLGARGGCGEVGERWKSGLWKGMQRSR